MSERDEQRPLSRSPCPLFFPLAEPEFEPQCVHSVQVVSEQPFVSDKTQVLIQLQGRFVGYFSLQYDLRTHTTTLACFIRPGATGISEDVFRCCGPHSQLIYLA